ncbi:SGNH/GDSL hydrolase family protein [Bradyrhizobium genosp. L]|uniref:SGNH/GDSL hydrolase family protein n=1 Tax=Bradyrhizobium genosp. L TaxID=83637 RepID=UPI0018A2C542|nr:SGNH/GDSL hydrolase family protein [Bradyrhizobium genosp. L]QPF81700.1 SGNH/GDSL hydrolase family protein [Bradyrhizobium genosp. L]
MAKRKGITRRELVTGVAALAAYSQIGEAEAFPPNKFVTLLGGARTPSWLPAGFAGALNFQTQQAYVVGQGYIPFSPLLTTARTTPELVTDYNGNVTVVGNNTAAISNAGLQIYGATTNVVLWNNDGTNAAWTKTNCTAALDQPAVTSDQTPNTATSLTATGANATCLQSITLASSARFHTAYVKRMVGSGEIDMTMDGGATWWPVTPYLNSSGYTRLSIPGKTLANPQVGFRIVTNGDKIAFGLVQNENHNFPSPAIPTTSAAVTRNQDVITGTAALRALISPTTGTIYEAYGTTYAPPAGIWSLSDGTTSNRMDVRSNQTGLAGSFITVGGVQQSGINVGSQGSPGSIAAAVMSYTTGSQQLAVNGALATPGTPGSIFASPTTMHFGQLAGNTNPLQNNLLVFAWSASALNGAAAQAMSAQAYFSLPANTIFCWGDSLTAGTEDGTNITYPNVLSTLYAPARLTENMGVGGQPSTAIVGRFLAAPFTWNYNSVLWLGRNNTSQGSTVQADIASMVAKLGLSRSLVLAVLNGEGEGSSSGTVYNNITALNAALSSTYGARYLDVRSMLVAAYNPANPVDVIDHTNDIPPFSLRAIDVTGTISTATVNPTDTAFSVSVSGLAANFILTVGTEYIYVNAVSGTSITSCVRGYAGTTAGTYSSGQTFSGTDNIHLSAAGYALVAQWVAAAAGY